MDIPDKIFFKIGEVSQIAGVKPYVLRYWEAEFAIVPQKSSAGQRLYRRRDIDRILLVKRLLYSEGFTIAGARKHLSRYGRMGAEGQEELEGPVQESASPGIQGGQEGISAGEARADESPVMMSGRSDEGGEPEDRLGSDVDLQVGTGMGSRSEAVWSGLEVLREQVTALQSLIRKARVECQKV